jgi:hypothetical protein
MHPLEIPQKPDDLTAEWLTRALQRAGLLDPASRVREFSMSDPGRESSYVGFVSRITLQYEPDSTNAPATMIMKLPAPERIIRRLFRSIYRTEVHFYRRLADQSRIPVPTCYAALLNRSRTRSLLLLEDLSPFATPGDHDLGCTDIQARAALMKLAAFHAQWWQRTDHPDVDWLGHYRVNSTRNWLIYAGAWVPFNLRLHDQTPPATRSLFRNLWRYRHTLQALEIDRPVSVQHGDFRLANLAFSNGDVYAFDWQVLRIGQPLFDVAWFMLTSLTVEQRRRIEASLLRGYHVALTGSGVAGYPFDRMVADYRLALLLTIPQIMVIGGFLRIDERRRAELGRLLRRFEAARADHDLEGMLTTRSC